jgi:signal transduction histidine kinase
MTAGESRPIPDPDGGVFLDGIALRRLRHDLRGPVFTIRIAAETLLEEEPTGDQLVMVQGILDATQELLATVDRLFDEDTCA